MSALEPLITTQVLADADDLGEGFVSAQPFRHVVIDDFFQPDFASKLLTQFPAFDERSAIDENGAIGNKAVHERVSGLGSAYQRLDKLVKSREFLQLVASITQIDELRYDPYYFGGGTHENRHGQDLDAHIDFNFHPITKQHRRLNLIVYLNQDWRSEWGGCLDLHRDPYAPPEQDQIVSVLPVFNRCVIFETTESSWHGFRRIDLPPDGQDISRKSFALYYYTDTRPAAETGKPHSTIYVERHLPDRFQAGYQLREDDTQELKVLLARRDQHLKRLYGNITELSWELEQARRFAGQGLLTRGLRRLRYQAGRVKRRLLG